MGQQVRINGRLVGQAQVGNTGQPRSRAVVRKSRRHEGVIEAAQSAIEVMDHFFPGSPWLEQVRDGLETYLQRCLEQFATSVAPTRNNAPIADGRDYREFARSAEEIKQDMAAEEAAVSAAPRRVPRYRERPDEIQIPESELSDPVAPRPQQEPKKIIKPDGWAL